MSGVEDPYMPEEGVSPVCTVGLTCSSTTPRPPSSEPSSGIDSPPLRAPKKHGGGFPKGKRWMRKTVTPIVEQEIAAMGALGVSRRVAATALRLPPSTVGKVLSSPHVQDLIGRFREAIRADSLERAVTINTKAWQLADEVLTKKDPRGFDSVMRGLHATEKIAASASGEARRIEGVFQVAHADLTEEARELLRALAESRSGPVQDP